MNEKCKYCNYVSKCSQYCEYNSVICKLHRSFPKVVDKSYNELIQENQELNKQLEAKETQQNEFIEWLDSMLVSELDVFTEVKICDVLSKYKEIIGDDK